MNVPFISIITPCYNIEKYVSKCIDSLSAQTFKNLEFIFINDGSTDGTLELLLNFKNKDERVVLIDKKNEGVSKARNDGLQIAKGEYVLYLDGDDYLDIDACERMYETVIRENADVLIFNICVISGKVARTRKLHIPVGVYTLTDFVKNITHLPISHKMYKRSIICNNRIFFDEDIRLGELITYFVHYLLHCDKIMVCDETCYNHVMRENSAFHDVENVSKDFAIIDSVQKLEYYAGMHEFPLLNSALFKKTVFKIICSFTLFKYIKGRHFSKEIRDTMEKIINHPDIKKYMKYFAYESPGFSAEKIFSIITLRSITMCYYVFSFYFKLRRIVTLKPLG